MKKGIHPIKTDIRILATKKNSYKINSIFNINKLKTTIDPFSHIVYNQLFQIKNTKDDINLNRLRLFKINK